jgi:MFS transporter, MHS family, proline/betaine transporter
MAREDTQISQEVGVDEEDEGGERRNEAISTSGGSTTSSSGGTAEFGRLICAIGVGNALEWFDFAIYGALADIIGSHFFPANEGQTALLASFSVYSSTFLMRPLGGIIMGYLGDNFGRKFALELSISLMVIPGFFMGCLPTFESVGYLATVLLVLLRMLQGLAVGGEMIGAYIFTIEACEPTQKGLWGQLVSLHHPPDSLSQAVSANRPPSVGRSWGWGL